MAYKHQKTKIIIFDKGNKKPIKLGNKCKFFLFVNLKLYKVVNIYSPFFSFFLEYDGFIALFDLFFLLIFFTSKINLYFLETLDQDICFIFTF